MNSSESVNWNSVACEWRDVIGSEEYSIIDEGKLLSKCIFLAEC